MDPLINLLQFPHGVEAKFTISDELLTHALKRYVRHVLLQDVSCTVKEDLIEIHLTVGVLMLAKHFTIDLEIEDVVIENNQCLLTFKVKSKSLSVITTVLNLLGSESLSFLKYEHERLHIDLSQQVEKILKKQPIALRNEWKQVRISKPILQTHFLDFTISKRLHGGNKRV